jgi:hypothetical protein
MSAICCATCQVSSLPTWIHEDCAKFLRCGPPSWESWRPRCNRQGTGQSLTESELLQEFGGKGAGYQPGSDVDPRD